MWSFTGWGALELGNFHFTPFPGAAPQAVRGGSMQALMPGTTDLGLERPHGAPPVPLRGMQPQCAQDFPWFSGTLAFQLLSQGLLSQRTLKTGADHIKQYWYYL